MTKAKCSASMIDAIARSFHESYERQAGDVGYETRKESAVPWADVSAANKELMRRVVADLLERGKIGRPMPKTYRSICEFVADAERPEDAIVWVDGEQKQVRVTAGGGVVEGMPGPGAQVIAKESSVEVVLCLVLSQMGLDARRV